MNTLELMLRDAGGQVDWPATPDLASAVAGRIAAAGPAAPAVPRRIGLPARRLRRPLALALAALLVLAAGAAAIPGVREPVLDFLGLRSVKIERVPRPLPVVPGAKLGLGQRTTLTAARPKLGFQPVAPSGLGAPVVWLDSFPEGGHLSLVYRGGRVLFSEVRGRLLRQFLFKFVGPDARVDAIRVNGERGVWIHGQPHQYAYADATGDIHTDSVRFAGDVLLWRRGDLLLRLEGARSKAEALRIAGSARAVP
jgi:hypothetical protein